MVHKRDNCFDFLRFLFALIVVVGHLIVLTDIPQWQPYKVLFNTTISVTGFFVISGFLITQSYTCSSSLSNYFTKRIKRLLPAYYIVVLVCAISLVGLSTYTPQEYFTHPQWLRYLLANMSFMNFLQPCLPGVFENNPAMCAVNGALWTLKIEVMFYLLLPLIIWGLHKVTKKWIILSILYVLSVLYNNILLELYQQSGINMFEILARQLPGYLSYFIVGMAIYYYKPWFVEHKNILIIPALLITCFEWYMAFDWLLPFAFGIVVLWNAFSIPVLNKFGRHGDISYGIYIYHCPIIQTFIALGIFSFMNLWLGAMLTIILILALGFLSWHGIEKRILKR